MARAKSALKLEPSGTVKQMKRPAKALTMTITVDGKEIESTFDLPPDDVNQVAFGELITKLLRLQPGEQLRLAHSELSSISPTDVNLACAIADAGVQCGCNVKMDEVIQTDPKVRGVIFDRQDMDPPILTWTEPEGNA